ncbi:MAG: glycosyltransferase family 39 protein [Elusimicrobiota bacterium]|jgi:hypothetical protein
MPDIRRRHLWILLAILLLGLGLRFRGISWGLPDQSRYYHGSSYHPDEQSMFYALKEISWSRRQFYPTDPIIGCRGTLQMYTIGLALTVCRPWLTIRPDSTYYQEHPQELSRIYRVGRWVSVLQSLAAVIALFWLSTLKTGNSRTGLIAAALLAVSPVHVVNAHYISTDSAFTLYLILLGIACLRIYQKGSLSAFGWAGFVFGLLTANKFNAVSALLIPLTADVLRHQGIKPGKNWILFTGTAVAGFLIGCPTPVLGPHDFVALLHHLKTMSLMKFSPLMDGSFPPSNLMFYGLEAFYFGLGIPLWIAVLAGTARALFRRDPGDMIWWPWLVIFFVLITNTSWRVMRWIIPLLIPMFLWTAEWLSTIRGRKTILAVVLLGTTVYSACYVYAMSTPDVRDTSSDWIAEHWPPNARVGFTQKPYLWDPTIFQMPYFHPQTSGKNPDQPAFKIYPLDESLQQLQLTQPDYLVANDYFTGVYRLNPSAYRLLPAGQFLAEVFNPAAYRTVATFGKRVRLGPIDLYGKDLRYPHDWRYPFPTITLMEKVP